MKFQLPQFIETEVKLVGPFTLKQFLWIASGAVLAGIMLTVLKGIWIFILVPPVALFFLGMAFIKIQGMPLVNYAAYALSYFLNPKKYIFSNEEQDVTEINNPQNLS